MQISERGQHPLEPQAATLLYPTPPDPFPAHLSSSVLPSVIFVQLHLTQEIMNWLGLRTSVQWGRTTASSSGPGIPSLATRERKESFSCVAGERGSCFRSLTGEGDKSCFFQIRQNETALPSAGSCFPQMATEASHSAERGGLAFPPLRLPLSSDLG